MVGVVGRVAAVVVPGGAGGRGEAGAVVGAEGVPGAAAVRLLEFKDIVKSLQNGKTQQKCMRKTKEKSEMKVLMHRVLTNSEGWFVFW